MAGVEFELKKLFRARTAAGKLKAYSWSLIITTGPFVLLASMVLFIQLLFAWLAVPESQSDLFIGTTVYAFIFSQLLASGFVAVQSRYLADCLSEKKYGDMTASLFGVQAILLVLGALAGLIFYAGSPLPWPDQLLGYLFFSELLLIWSQGVYLTAVRRFKNLIWGYLAGAGIGVAVAAVLLFQTALPAGRCATLGVVCGLGVIVLSLYLSIFAYFGLPGQGRVFWFLPYLDRHWRVFLEACCYSLALFLPNLLIWQGPWSQVTAGTYRFAPVYDVITCYAFISILPLRTMFVVSAETEFYDRYAVYFDAIIHKGNYRDIEDARQVLLFTIWYELRKVMGFQFLFTLLFLAGGTYVLNLANVDYEASNLYNILLMAAFFTGVTEVVSILFLYFDAQPESLRLMALFLGLNLVLSGVGMYFFSTDSYGFTFFLASGAALFYGLHSLSRFADKLNYYIFCGQPVFYRPRQALMTKICRRLYPEADTEKGGL